MSKTKGPTPDGRTRVPAGLRPASSPPPGLRPASSPPPGLQPLPESRSTGGQAGEPTPPPEAMKLRPDPADVARPVHATDVDHAVVRQNREDAEEAERQQERYNVAVRAIHSNLGAQASHIAPGSGSEVQRDWIETRSRE